MGCYTLGKVSTWMGGSLWTGKLLATWTLGMKTTTHINSAFHPSGVSKSSTSLPAWG